MQLIRQRLRGLRDERGQSLVIALLVMTFLAVSLGTVMFFTAGNQRNANYQKAAQLATSLAEAGVNNGVAVLSDPNNTASIEIAPGATGAVLPGPAPATPQSATYNGHTVKWWGSLNTDASWKGKAHNVVWTVYGQASVPNPISPNASIVKQVSAQVRVNAPPPETYDGLVWNSVYSPFGPTTGCDTSIGQGVNVTIPLYVGGNLCMANSSSVNAPLYVGGYLNVSNKQAWIGCTKITGNTCATPAPISSAHVSGWCAGPSGQQDSPCVSEPMPSGKQDTNIYVQSPLSWVATAPAADFAGIAAPKICWIGSAAEIASGACDGSPPGGWYSFASPGPKFPCGGAVQFDTDQVWGPNEGYPNGSLPTTFNLTPTTAYTCQTGQGELSWDPTTRTLRVVGTIFFDGNITATTSGNQPIKYTGAAGNNCTNTGDCQAVIFASGDISINSEKLCAVINTQGTDCDWSSNWDPNKRLLIFASNGTTGVTVGPSQTEFEGGLYATNTVATGQSAITEGPLVSGTKTVVLGQQFGGTFPLLTIAPWSINHQPGGYWIDPPTNFQYGS